MKKAAATRLNILRKAFDLIYVNGYKSTSIDDIIAQTQVTKGAFFYHFKSKNDMGFAIINEILKPTVVNDYIIPLQCNPRPLEAIYHLIRHLLLENKFMKVQYGCPAANLTQELSPWNTEFNKVLEALTKQWVDAMTKALEQGKKKGYVRKDVRSKQVSLFIISSYWGIRNFGKLANSKKVFQPYLKELTVYLESLR